MDVSSFSRNGILIVDFGSQYTQLIARRIRAMNVYCEIRPFSISATEVLQMAPQGLILSGGPSSVYEKEAPSLAKEIFDLHIPILGICYGAQLMVAMRGGKVEKGVKKEFGRAVLSCHKPSKLLQGVKKTIEVWMSHGDHIGSLPASFQGIASTDTTPFAVFSDEKISQFGIQFHPEVMHTQEGDLILSNFVTKICGANTNWNMSALLPDLVEKVKAQVKEGHCLCAVSGGVDSMVAAALVQKAIGQRLSCVFVDTGLMRDNERAEIQDLFTSLFERPLFVVDAKERFLQSLMGVLDPEEKRKKIGALFVQIFDETSRKFEEEQKTPISFLVQGTLYPDVIESAGTGAAVTIKTHHNVGGLPKEMKFSLVEPLRALFKDEVRLLGKELGLPERMTHRQPFPGPGLAVRIVGEVTQPRVERVRAADLIVEQEMRKSEIYGSLWQSFAVLLPIKSVGVMGDHRSYEETIAIRAVTSFDGMTADFAELPYPVLSTISRRIVNEVPGINRVVYDITSKPPGTIEWE